MSSITYTSFISLLKHGAFLQEKRVLQDDALRFNSPLTNDRERMQSTFIIYLSSTSLSLLVGFNLVYSKSKPAAPLARLSNLLRSEFATFEKFQLTIY